MPKTASSSLSSLLSRYAASEHEYEHEYACKIIWRYEQIHSEWELVHYFRNRAKALAGHDIASFLHQLDFNLLEKCFPASKFLAVAREPSQWIASFLAMILDYSKSGRLSQLTFDLRFLSDYAMKISPSLSFLGLCHQLASDKRRGRIIQDFLDYWILWFNKINNLGAEKEIFIYTDVCRLHDDIIGCYQRLHGDNLPALHTSNHDIWLNKCPAYYTEFKKRIQAETQDMPLYPHALRCFAALSTSP